jgi:hypothetical protein
MAPSFIRSTALTWTEPDDPEAQFKEGVGWARRAPFIALDFAHRCSRCRTTRFARRAAGSRDELRFIARARERRNLPGLATPRSAIVSPKHSLRIAAQASSRFARDRRDEDATSWLHGDGWRLSRRELDPLQ